MYPHLHLAKKGDSLIAQSKFNQLMGQVNLSMDQSDAA